jgi:regulator of sigma E protease
MSTVIQLLIVLGIMVLVHEFGHFAVAKLCGVRVEVFSIGFGKRLIGFRHGDTEYQLSLLPLGGYVKMAGEAGGAVEMTEDGAVDPGNFSAHPRWQRVLIAFAGPMANFILAFVLMTGVSMLHNEVEEFHDAPVQTDYVPLNTPVARTGIHSGDTVVHYATIENPTWDEVMVRSLLNLNQTVPFSYVHDGKRVDTTIFIESKNGAENFSPDKFGLVPKVQNTPVQVAELEANMPAARAGLQPKDQIATIDGLSLHSVPALLAYLQDQAGKPAALTILRNGTQTIPIELTPELAKSSDGTDRYRLGFLPVQPPVRVEKLPLGKAMAASWAFNVKSSTLILEVLKGMFTRHVSVRSLSGPIGIGQQVHQAVEMPGWMPIIGLMAYISLNLGIFNLLPFPVLDGGMITMLGIESVMRRDINQDIKERMMQVAIVCILIFGVLVIFNDLSKLSIFSKLKP